MLLVAVALGFGGAIGFADERASEGRVARAARARASATTPRRADLAALDVRRATLREGHLVAPLEGGASAVLTIDPELQSFTERMFEQYEVPYASVVALDPDDGRVLAYVSHSSANPEAADLAIDATPPAASVFKVITGAALVDHGVSPDTRVCYGGGSSALSRFDIVDDPRRDRQCATLADAMGQSINAVFAKLALRHLSPGVLERYASAFAWGQGLPFDARSRPSPAQVPTEPLEFARTSAGFWHMHMSPLHAALIAATIANDGQMPRATLVERVEDERGRATARREPATYRAVLSAATARSVGQMMRRTVTTGTSRHAFADARGRPYLPGIDVAGKTGTLSAANPYRGYTWWVGFAPVERPTIALAVLVVNRPEWRIKASYAAREVLRAHLVELPARRARAARANGAPAAASTTRPR